MAADRLTVQVDGVPVSLWRGARVRDALVSAAGGRRLVRLVEAGTHAVIDDTVSAEVDLGGALYDGQRLRVTPRAGAAMEASSGA